MIAPLVFIAQEDNDLEYDLPPYSNYPAVEPLVHTYVDWQNIEVEADSNRKKEEFAQCLNVEDIYFYYPDWDLDEPQDPIPMNWHGLHLLDYDMDGLDDMIYEFDRGMTGGYATRFIKGTESGYELQYTFLGKIVEAEFGVGSFDFSIHAYPCCDGYRQEFTSLRIRDMQLEQLYQYNYVQSNLEHRTHNLPSDLQESIGVEWPAGVLDRNVVVYYRGSFEIEYPEFSSELTDTSLVGYHPFAEFSIDTPYELLAGETVDGVTVYLARFLNEPSRIMRHMNRSSNDLREVLDTDPQAIDYLGWIKATDL